MRNSKFKVFINDDAEKQTLGEELRDMCHDFFKHCKFQIRKTYIMEEELTKSKNLKQGGLLIRNMENDRTKSRGGTLGGFVYQTDNHSKKYALTCHHLFTEINMPAYVKGSKSTEEIGECFFYNNYNNCRY